MFTFFVLISFCVPRRIQQDGGFDACTYTTYYILLLIIIIIIVVGSMNDLVHYGYTVVALAHARTLYLLLSDRLSPAML